MANCNVNIINLLGDRYTNPLPVTAKNQPLLTNSFREKGTYDQKHTIFRKSQLKIKIITLTIEITTTKTCFQRPNYQKTTIR